MASVPLLQVDPLNPPARFRWAEPLVEQLYRRVSRSQFGLVACAIFLLALVARLMNLHQPLLENFVDRQVHTAMMARNLARGGSPFYPAIDIGPFPAYYMLECPGYPALVATLSSVTGLELDMAGRLTSSLAIAVACVLLAGLVRRHDGPAVGLLAGAVLALMPVTIRYGRAFQPDATMLALLIGGVWAMDRWAEQGRGRHLVLAVLATSAALLLKVISAYVLLPLAYLAWKRCGWSSLRRGELWAALLFVALPSAAWYVHAWHVASGTATVSTPFWHAHKWVSIERLFDPGTYRQLAYYIGLRVLTPIGVFLAGVGALLRAGGKPQVKSTEPTGKVPVPLLFHVWLLSLAAYFPILVRKLDHEHYYLALAPVAACFIARALVAIASAPLASRFYVSGRWGAAGLGVALLASNLLACGSTFRIPSEWTNVTAAAAAARDLTPPNSLVAAHSSVLFYADRRGFTFAYAPDEIEYLFGTWGEHPSRPSPAGLLEFYRERGADYFVELLGTGRERHNREFFESLRSRYRVVREVPGQYIVVALRGYPTRGFD